MDQPQDRHVAESAEWITEVKCGNPFTVSNPIAEDDFNMGGRGLNACNQLSSLINCTQFNENGMGALILSGGQMISLLLAVRNLTDGSILLPTI